MDLFIMYIIKKVNIYININYSIKAINKIFNFRK